MNKFLSTKSIRRNLIISFLLLLIFSITSTAFFLNYALRKPKPVPINVPPEVMWQGRNNVQKYIQERIEEERNETEAKLVTASFFVIGAQIIVAIAGSMYLANRIVTPLENLTITMKNISKTLEYTELKSTDPRINGQEIASLSTSFNNMMEKLKNAFESQKEFVANVSHEIKTPLTVIQTNLESIKLSKKISKSEIDEAIASSLGSIKFLNTLTDDLLLLSLLDRREIKTSKIKLDSLLTDLHETFIILTKKSGHNLNILNLAKKAQITCNESLLKRAISNIVENALKYTPVGSNIDLVADKTDTNIVIKISDNGHGIEKDELYKIFERFYRVDKSRSRKSGGKGLGLSITKDIVEFCKGSISVESSSKGTIFIILLPLLSS